MISLSAIRLISRKRSGMKSRMMYVIMSLLWLFSAGMTDLGSIEGSFPLCVHISHRKELSSWRSEMIREEL